MKAAFQNLMTYYNFSQVQILTEGNWPLETTRSERFISKTITLFSNDNRNSQVEMTALCQSLQHLDNRSLWIGSFPGNLSCRKLQRNKFHLILYIANS